MKNKIEVVIFDMGGLMFDTETLFFYCRRRSGKEVRKNIQS